MASRRLSPLLLAVAMLAPPGSASVPGRDLAAARQAERVTDADGHVYRTVRIGAQTWMAENLRSTRHADGTPLQSFAYRNDSSLARVYGLLYRWPAAR